MTRGSTFVCGSRRSLLLAAGLVLTACAAGPATKALDTESVASLLTYRDGAEAGVAALLAAYREVSLRELRLLAELDSRDSSSGGTIGLGAALTILDEYAAARVRLDAEISKFSAAWEENRRNIEDALALRAQLREWLERGGVEPEDVEGIVDGIADAVEGRTP